MTYEIDPGDVDDKAAWSVAPDYCCKHCDAVFDDCPECDGTGLLDETITAAVALAPFLGVDPDDIDDEDPEDAGEPCPACKGTGVIERTELPGGGRPEPIDLVERIADRLAIPVADAVEVLERCQRDPRWASRENPLVFYWLMLRCWLEIRCERKGGRP